ncbi:DUF6182 family protein [Kitasatospora sp. NPDC059463]|uniref:DUF6182 family protein n=1 Tax=unclassified Kitasatospora TaxID=2633591 RepID=UPI0036CA7033
MPITPELLLSVAAERLRTALPELAGRLDLSTPQALRAAKAEITARDGTADGTVAVAVIGRFSLDGWVRETCRFALGVPEDRAAPWRRAFTRTVFLAGRPENLRERFAFEHIAPDGSAAWAGPGPDGDSASLRRLLKTFDGRRPLGSRPPLTVEVPAAPAAGPPAGPATGSPAGSRRRPRDRDLYLATAGVTVSDALVQLNHLLVEAVLDGLIHPGDRLTLRPVPRLTGMAVPFTALRIDTDTHHPHKLQAYAGLTEET